MDWLISRACRPTWESPISPSNSFCGTRAATESMTITSTALDLISISVMCMASSPLLGWLTSRVSSSTPSFLAQLGSRACSASMKAAMPPRFLGLGDHVQGQRGLAAGFRPEDLHHPAPRNALPAQGQIQRQAAGGNAVDRADLPSPRGMMAPSPNCFSIWATVFFSEALPSSTEAIDGLTAPSSPLTSALAAGDFVRSVGFLAIFCASSSWR